MAIPVACQCGQQFAADDSLAGTSQACPACGFAISIPVAQQPATTSLQPDPPAKPSPAARSESGKSRVLIRAIVGGVAVAIAVVVVFLFLRPAPDKLEPRHTQSGDSQSNIKMGTTDDGESESGRGGLRPNAEIVETYDEQLLADAIADFKPAANGGSDHSGQGKWNYLTSHTLNPTDPNSQLADMAWDEKANAFEAGTSSNDGKVSWPNVSQQEYYLLASPSPNSAQYCVVRWTSGYEGEIAVRGSFAKQQERGGDGVELAVFVDGNESFHQQMEGGDFVGLGFEAIARVQQGSSVDVVVGRKGPQGGDTHTQDATEVIAAIFRREKTEPNVPPYDPSNRTEFEQLEEVTTLAISRDKTKLITYQHPLIAKGEGPDRRHVITVWDLATGRKLRELDDPIRLGRMAVSPDGRYLAGLFDRDLEQRLWDLDTGKVAGQFKRGRGFISRSLDFSYDSSAVILPGNNSYILVETDTGETHPVNPPPGQVMMRGAAFSPRYYILAVSMVFRDARNDEIRMHDLGTGSHIETIKAPYGSGSHFAFTDDESKLVTVHGHGKITVIDFDERKTILEMMRPKDDKKLAGIERVKISPDGNWILTLPMYTGRPFAELWHVPTRSMRKIGTEWCHDFAFYDNNTALLTCYQDTPAFYDLKTGHRVSRPELTLLATKKVDDGSDDAADHSPLETAQSLRVNGQYKEAAEAYANLVIEARKKLGKTHQDTIELTRTLAQMQRSEGNLAIAELSFERCFQASEAALNERSSTTTADLRDLAETIVFRGEFSRAIETVEGVIKMRIERLGGNHPAVCDGHAQLGDLFVLLGDVSTANHRYQMAVDIGRKAFQVRNPTLPAYLMKAGHTYGFLQEFDRALPLSEEAVAGFKKFHGVKPHGDLAEAYMRLSQVYRMMLRNNESSQAFQSALTVMSQIDRQESRQSIYLSVQVARGLASNGRANEAEIRFRKLLEPANRVYGPNHVRIANIYSEMAQNYLRADLRESPKKYQTIAMDMLKELYGDDYPNRAHHLNLYAKACAANRKWEEAEWNFRRSREVADMGTTGGRYTAVDASMSVANMMANRRIFDRARDEFDQAMRQVHSSITEVLPIMPDRYKVRYANGLAANISKPLSMAFAFKQEQAWVDASAEWALNMKGLVNDVLAKQALLVRNSATPEEKKTALELIEVRNKIASQAVSGFSMYMSTESNEQLAGLKKRESELTVELGRQLKGRAAVDSWVGLEEIRKSIDPKSVLIEISRLRYYDYAQDRFRGAYYRWKERRYVAWVIPPTGDGQVQLFDLGSARQIDAHVQQYLFTLDNTTTVANFGTPEAIKRMADVTRQLSTPLIGKLEPAINKYDRWLISPDHSLWLVAWHAMKSSQGKYLVDSKEIGCLTTSRLLVTQRHDVDPLTSTIVANPDYNLGVSAEDGAFERFIPLPGTAREAETVAPKLEQYVGQKPNVLMEQEALEDRVKELRSPRVLLLSTHGYFEAYPRHQHALLRCGLAFAGANRLGLGRSDVSQSAGLSTGNDGILTGLEVTNIDLRGTDLVVLSACESGLGEVSAGEGVAGLRQSFQLSGAKSVAATLWSVTDDTTADIMSAFFGYLAEGRRATEAMRLAQRAVKDELADLRGEDYAHPMFWAPFVISGLPD